MEKGRFSWKNIPKKAWVWISLLPLLLLLPWNLLAVLGMDDPWFASQPLTIDYFVNRYLHWNPRLFIEIFLLFFARNFRLWQVANFLVILLLGFLLQKIFANTISSGWFAVSLILFYPINIMLSTGYVAVTTNYLWVFTFGLLALYPLIKIYRKERIRIFEYPFYILALLYGSNQEQMMVITVLVSALMLYLLRKREGMSKILIFPAIQMVLALANGVFIALSPGNAVRRLDEIQWFLDYDRLSFLTKTNIGLSRTLSFLFFTRNDLFLLLCLGLALLVWSKREEWLARLVSLVPVLTCLIFGYGFADSRTNYFRQIVETAQGSYEIYGVQDFYKILAWPHGAYGVVDVRNFSDIKSFLAMMILGIGLICGGISIFLAFEKVVNGWIAFGILALGIGTSLMMMLSPTMWVSGDRTNFFLHMALICTAIVLFREGEDSGFEMKDAVKICLIVGGILCISNYFVSYEILQ